MLGAVQLEGTALTSLWQLVQLLLLSNRLDSWLTTFTS
jgi:hypothetical protein